MISNVELLQKIAVIAERDGRYSKEAFLFMLAALEFALSKLPKRRHLTGQELSVSIAEYTREQYGYLAGTVLNNWRLYTTRDFGEIVYLLIDAELMSKNEDDKLEDFEDVFDYKEQFSWEQMKPRKFPERF